MQKIMPLFNDDKDKIVIVAMVICSMFFIFIPALIVVLFFKDKVSESSYLLAKAFLNFELLLFLISLTFAIPIIGWILGFILAPLIMIYNLIVCLMALCAIAKNIELKIPVVYEFI